MCSMHSMHSMYLTQWSSQSSYHFHHSPKHSFDHSLGSLANSHEFLIYSVIQFFTCGGGAYRFSEQTPLAHWTICSQLANSPRNYCLSLACALTSPTCLFCFVLRKVWQFCMHKFSSDSPRFLQWGSDRPWPFTILSELWCVPQSLHRARWVLSDLNNICIYSALFLNL